MLLIFSCHLHSSGEREWGYTDNNKHTSHAFTPLCLQNTTDLSKLIWACGLPDLQVTYPQKTPIRHKATTFKNIGLFQNIALLKIIYGSCKTLYVSPHFQILHERFGPRALEISSFSAELYPHCVSPKRDFATSSTHMDAVITLIFCLTIPTGDQSGADGNSFMRPHPFPTPKLCFVLTSMSFFKTEKYMHTCTHKQSLKNRLQNKEETHQTSNSLAHSASGFSQGNSLPCQTIQEFYISRLTNLHT